MASSLTVSVNYKTIRIPLDSPYLASIIAKYRATKIGAMKADPASFWAKHDQELALAFSIWEVRFKICAATLVCVATTDLTLSDEDTLLQKEWVGFASIRGPMDYATYYPNPDMEQPIPEDPSSELRWHIFDLYILPGHRQRGLAKKLLVGSIDAAVGLSTALCIQGKRRARLRLFVDSRNTWLVQWYELMSFAVSGKASPREGYTVNGLSESIPEMTDELRVFWDSRIGFAMERVVELDEAASNVGISN
jgi:ribosomal protein S18 acetylase RimI-like enzyme